MSDQDKWWNLHSVFAGTDFHTVYSNTLKYVYVFQMAKIMK